MTFLNPFLISRHRWMLSLFLSAGLLATTKPVRSQLIPAGGPPGVLVVDMAVTDSAIYVASLHSLYRSSDYGLSWTKLLDIPFNKNLKGTNLFLPVQWMVKALHDKVFFHYHDDSSYRLLVSVDRGNSWTTRSYPTYNNQKVYSGQWALTDSLFLLRNGKRIFYSSNNAVSWSWLPMPGHSDDGLGMAVDGNWVYCWNNDSLFLSRDYLKTWEGNDFQGFGNLKVQNGFLFARASEANGIKNFWASKGWGLPWGKKTNLMHLSEFDVVVVSDTVLLWPNFPWENEDYLWVGDTAQLQFTKDLTRRTPIKGYFSLMDTRLMEISDRLFIRSPNRIGFSSYGHSYWFPSLWHSDDFGRRWTTRENTLEEPMLNDLYADGERIWAATSSGLFYQIAGQDDWQSNDTIGLAIFSATRFDGQLWKSVLQLASVAEIGLYASDDEGNSWHQDFSASDYPLISTPLALFQYFGGSVFRRFPDDGGWKEISDKIPGQFVNSGILDVYYKGLIFTYDDQGVLYSSSDAGEHWNMFPFPTNIYTPLHLLTMVDSMLVFVGGRRDPVEQEYQFEVYRWHDDIEQWTLLSNSIKISYSWEDQNHYRKIIGLVSHAGKWFLVVRGVGILESVNNGADWSILANNDVAKNAMDVEVVGDWLYVGSQFFGVWKMKLDAVGQQYIYTRREMRLFPNPNDGHVVRLEATQPLERIWVFDLDGRLVLENGPTNSSVTLLNLSGLSSGFYFVKILDAEGVMTVQKMLVAR
ncbi:MAG: T9SS type A sorting domain-containing protein [Saprospiraceae bacterium]|nr:T9SS type A sorting domain-containing protein [Saprospiraceae bacterium]